VRVEITEFSQFSRCRVQPAAVTTGRSSQYKRSVRPLLHFATVSRGRIVSDTPVTRRDFARHFTLGTGFALVGATAGAAGDDKSQAPSETKPQTEQSDAPPPEPEDYQLAALIREYPSDHLTEEMLAGIRAGLSRNRRQAAVLRAAGLANSDEPAFVFRAYRKE